MIGPHGSKPRGWLIGSHFGLTAGLLLISLGCGGPTACTVTGKVLVDDQPAEGVYVVFHTVEGSTARPDTGTARSRSDGSFSLLVSEPGEATVTAFWPKVIVKDVETIEGPDRFHGVYRDPQRPVTKVAIHEGDNVLPPISLNRPAPSQELRRARR